MWQHAFARRLAVAHTFADVGAIVCRHTREVLGGARTMVSLFAREPNVAIVVDDFGRQLTNDERLERAQRSMVDPALAQLLAHHAPVGSQTTRWNPLVEPLGLLGYVRSEAASALSRAQQRDLDVAAAYASARLVQLGVTATTASIALRKLTARQREVAELAAAGRTNDEIAALVGASVNTIKKHLKLVFGELRVQSRTELAARFARIPIEDELPVGVSQLDDVWVTKTGTRSGTRRTTTIGRG
jgi:DNA-binding CsgD family transcriptional regulator